MTRTFTKWTTANDGIWRIKGIFRSANGRHGSTPAIDPSPKALGESIGNRRC